jgi:hypothetical protein
MLEYCVPVGHGFVEPLQTVRTAPRARSGPAANELGAMAAAETRKVMAAPAMMRILRVLMETQATAGKA